MEVGRWKMAVRSQRSQVSFRRPRFYEVVVAGVPPASCHLSPFTRHFFLTNNHTPRDTNARTRAAAAQAREPTGPHFVVAKVKPGSGIRNRKADKIKNINALMMNELGSIRLPPGI